MNSLIKSILVCGIASTLPMVSYADLKVFNHSKVAATADAFNPKTNYHSPCSSYLGSSGVMEPNGDPVTIPDWAINMTCQPKCEVNIYMDRSCASARKFATAVVEPKNGVTSVNNLPNADGITINKKTNTELSIEGGSKASIFETMLKKLGV